MKIQVTQKDINNGRPGKGHWCPVALAISRVYPNNRVYVGEDFINLHNTMDGEIDKQYPLEGAVKEFVNTFDNENAVYPFEFELS